MPLLMNLRDATEKLKSINQLHLFRHWEVLSDQQQKNLLQQVSNLDLNRVQTLQHTIQNSEKKEAQSIPFVSPQSVGKKDRDRGKELAAQGSCATLILAGGQGSRLRFMGPKGCFPISPIKKKSLYQLVAEKIHAASRQVGRPVPLLVMTSPLNHKETEFFFAENNFFDLKPSQITFFSQNLWPLFDFHGNLFLETQDQIALGPNGNGSLFRALAENGIVSQLQSQNVEYLEVIPIDNPLADPVDYELFGFHARGELDVSLKTAPALNTNENAGFLALQDGKLVVVEYTEMGQEERKNYNYINLGIYCFSLLFIQKIAKMNLPLHVAKKATKKLRDEKSLLAEEPNAWKCEEFIFDVFLYAKKIEALLTSREAAFAPLKNLSGEDSIDTVQAALFALNRKIFTSVTGVEVDGNAQFELDAQFFYSIDK